MAARLALHTWTLLTTPVAEILAVAARTGWDAIEISRQSIAPAAPSAAPAVPAAAPASPSLALPLAEIGRLVKASGLPVACVGAGHGWMWADGDTRRAMLATFDEACAFAAALGCRTVMSPVDHGTGDLARAAASVREVGDIAARHGVILAVEFNALAQQLNTLERARELLGRAAHPACGLLLDTYHLGRSGATLAQMEDVASREIAFVQYSDVPRTGLRPGFALDRLPPGRGRFAFAEFFALVAAKGYAGYLSYEAPNETAWTRPAEQVAREAITATRAVLPRS